MGRSPLDFQGTARGPICGFLPKNADFWSLSGPLRTPAKKQKGPENQGLNMAGWTGLEPKFSAEAKSCRNADLVNGYCFRTGRKAQINSEK
jgi:hypothetical protein